MISSESSDSENERADHTNHQPEESAGNHLPLTALEDKDFLS